LRLYRTSFASLQVIFDKPGLLGYNTDGGVNERTYAVGVSREVWRTGYPLGAPPKTLFFLGHCGGFAAAVTEKRESWGGRASPNPSTA
jgi:hypothetical protein